MSKGKKKWRDRVKAIMQSAKHEDRKRLDDLRKKLGWNLDERDGETGSSG